MKSWLMPLMCAAALTLPMFSSDADASVKGKTYDVVGFTTLFSPFDAALGFNQDGSITVDFGDGDYTELDLGFLSLVNIHLVSQEDDIEIDLVGLQLGSILIGRGSDSDDVQYFIFGQEVDQQ